MAEPFLGEIRMFGGNFAPLGWLFCEGQVLPISQYTALFSLLGTQYGGNGTSNFALPDLRGRVPLSAGRSTLGTQYNIGDAAGSETVTLTESTLPAHRHDFVSGSAPNRDTPVAGVLASPGAGPLLYAPIGTSATLDTGLDASANAPVGGGQPHLNFMPYLCASFIIATAGIFPSRA